MGKKISTLLIVASREESKAPCDEHKHPP